MSEQDRSPSLLPWVGVAAAVVLTVGVAVVIIRSAPLGPVPSSTSKAATPADSPPPILGVQAVLTADGVTVRRPLPALAFALDVNQTLDARLPAGAFDGEFIVTFQPGTVRRAIVGAEIVGGSLIIERKGKVLASDYAGREAHVVMTDTVFLPGRSVTFTYRFRSDGAGPTRLRALWQPQDAALPLALPIADGGLPPDDVVVGLALVQQFNCAACHASDEPDLQAELDVNPAPILGHVGARARPGWIREWIGDPEHLKPGAAMPSLFHADELAADQIEDLTHFLVSMGGPMRAGAGVPSPDLIDTGMVLYHSVGCFACHGPLESIERLPGHRPPGPEASETYTPLGPLAVKTTPEQLAAFLRDPVGIRPSGRMPSQNLTDLEVEAIASYLIDRTIGESLRIERESFLLDVDRVERGRGGFTVKGCANCHSLGPDRPTMVSQLHAPSFQRIIASSIEPEPRGCLAEVPPPGSADFGLDSSQRTAIVAFLKTVPMRRSHDVPHDRLSATVRRLKCVACHQLHGRGGPERAVRRYFVTSGDYDLGDEGRLPPDLTGVGARLNPQWLRRVLVNQGTARPYLGARMPQFGEANVGRLPQAFAAVAGVDAEPDHGPEFSAQDAAVGRELVGDGGFTCIQCHSIAGRPATDLPGPDLAQMVERLRYQHFSAWLHDPKQLRPNTRMPSFFVGGRSGLTEHFGGDADRQIMAMWAYLSQGELLPLPDGLIDPGRYQLQVTDEPVVFRTFMQDVGPRAIACGFPEQVHCAFDAQNCVLRLVWVGRFLNATGAWAARGGSETNPQQEPVWIASDQPNFSVRIGTLGSSGSTEPCVGRFRGYRLDADRRPVFMYDMTVGDIVIKVAEQPIPQRQGTQASLLRRFVLEGPANTSVTLHLPGHQLISATGEWVAQGDGGIELFFDSQGRAACDMELTW